MQKRKMVLMLLDKLRFRILTTRYIIDKPATRYQPIPFMGITEAKRSIGSISRFNAMKSYLDRHALTNGTVVDYGCNVGYFSLSLCREGFRAYGVERDWPSLDIAYTSARIAKLPFYPVHLMITPQTIDDMPCGDVSICLSVWHHWVREYGMNIATDLLKSLFAKTRKVLFFDTGEREMSADYHLPFADNDPQLWLENYFKQHLSPSGIELLGQFKAFSPKGTEKNQSVVRHLFAIAK